MQRNLEVEALEDRLLATANLVPLPVPPMNLTNPVQAMASSVSSDLAEHDGSRAGSGPQFGMRTNHNETLVCDCGRRTRTRRARRK